MGEKEAGDTEMLAGFTLRETELVKRAVLESLGIFHDSSFPFLNFLLFINSILIICHWVVIISLRISF